MGSNLFDLTGRTALVTGSSRGIGFTLAQGLARAGARVVLNARDPKALKDAAAILADEGLDAVVSTFDVTDSAAVTAAVDAFEAELGPIDICVLNAGIQRRVPLQDLDDATWHEVLEANLSGAFYAARAVSQHMIRRGSGKIITTCSVMSAVGRPGTGAYTATKGGLKMLTQAMCADWARFGIQVNGIGPGYFATELTKALVDDEQFSAWVRTRTPAGRWGDTSELVGAAVFLASAASSFVNGQIIYVDGGMLSVL
jgi:gluconate 5-dehydrogenase